MPSHESSDDRISRKIEFANGSFVPASESASNDMHVHDTSSAWYNFTCAHVLFVQAQVLSVFHP